MKGKSFFTVILVLINLICFAQIKNNPDKQRQVSKSKYQPKTVIVKFKPDFKHVVENHKMLEAYSSVSNDLRSCKGISLTKLFKSAQPPSRSHNERGDEMVDLSLISEFTYQADISVEKIIAAFYKSGLVEYAEPKYITQAEYKFEYTPNDRYAQKDSTQALLFQRHNTYAAWNISKGDTNVVIGIIDTGIDFTHPDLAGNIKYNYADPLGDGVDNDHDGYIDNYRGWDFGSNDNNPKYVGTFSHGVSVQSLSSAVTDNTIGMAGTGFKCKALPLKISDNSGSLLNGYAAIVYAADHGCKIINCSWGGATYSKTDQLSVNYAAINHDVLIVASAGNDLDIDLDYYPASYDNVLSVTGLDARFAANHIDTVEVRGTVSATQGNIYSFNVDVGAINGGWAATPGGYKPFAGTSFASPVVAGAAGLIRSKYPLLSAAQVGELIRVNGSILDTFPETFPESRYKLGRKMDMYKALTNLTIPSVRMKSFSTTSKFSDSIYFSGDTVTITNQFFNYLSKANNVTITMRCINGLATVIDSISVLGMIDSLTGKSNSSDGFKIVIKSDSVDSKVELVMFYSDPSKNYSDFQGFKIPINPSYITIDTNQLSLSIGNAGRLGYNTYSIYTAPGHFDGVGFNYGAFDLLYESGLMIGLDTHRVSNSVRNSGSAGYDSDFKIIKNLRYSSSTIKDVETKSTYNDSLATNIIGVSIEQRSYAWKNSPNDKYIIVEYQIKNNRSTVIDSLYAGIFADWDIDVGDGDPNFYTNNRADWDDEDKIGYAYHSAFGSKLAGITLLTNDPPSCFSIDNNYVGGNDINMTDGFSSPEKYYAMSSGVYRKQAGTSGTGNDISQVVSTQLKNITPNEIRTIAFAFLAGDNLLDIKTTAKAAKAKFKSIKTGPLPVISNQHICAKDSVDISIIPSNGTLFNFYDTLNAITPIHQGANYTLINVHNPDTVYIANNDSLFTSNAVPFIVSKDNMIADFYLLPDTIDLSKNRTVYFVNESLNTNSIFWDFGDGTTNSGSVTKHDYTVAGTYHVKLKTTSTASCTDSITKTLLVTGTITGIDEALSNGIIKIYPNPVGNVLNIDFATENYQGLNVSVFDALGKEIYSSIANAQTVNINMAAQPSGVYYLKLKSEGTVSTKKFLKY